MSGTSVKKVTFRFERCRLEATQDTDFVFLGEKEQIAAILPFGDDIWEFRVIIRRDSED